MTIVADCGSTKTAWVDVATGQRFDTQGLNPHFTTDEALLAACAAVRRQYPPFDAQPSIHFYGAGCGLPQQQRRVARLLEQGFGTADVHVETDMLAACRAVSHGHHSVVAILGTGSNICLFDGERIVHQPTSTGYILGDRGSANHVGRLLLDEYLTRRMPSAERRLFHAACRMSDAELMDAVYHQPCPNRFLGQLAVFAVQNMADEYCARIIGQAVDEWYHNCLSPLAEGKTKSTSQWDGTVNFVGGFAKAIEPVLQTCFGTRDTYAVGRVVANPIEGLLQYHKNC